MFADDEPCEKKIGEKAGRRKTHLIWVSCMVGSGDVCGGLREQEGLVSAFPADNPASTSTIPALCFKPISVWPWPAIIIDRAVGSALSDINQIIHMDFKSFQFKTIFVLVQNSESNDKSFGHTWITLLSLCQAKRITEGEVI